MITMFRSRNLGHDRENDTGLLPQVVLQRPYQNIQEETHILALHLRQGQGIQCAGIYAQV
jgi:hypothetical protein